MLRLCSVERVQRPHSEPDHIGRVARNQNEIVHLRCRGKQSINDRDRPRCRHPPPSVDYGRIHADDANPKGIGHVAKPVLQRASLRWITMAHALDPSADFADRQHAEEQVALLDPRPPGSNGRMAARPLSDLGNDVGVDEPAHRSIARPVSRDRVRSMSSRGAAASRFFRLRVSSGAKRRRSRARASPAWSSPPASAPRRGHGPLRRDHASTTARQHDSDESAARWASVAKSGDLPIMPCNP